MQLLNLWTRYSEIKWKKKNEATKKKFYSNISKKKDKAKRMENEERIEYLNGDDWTIFIEDFANAVLVSTVRQPPHVHGAFVIYRHFHSLFNQIKNYSCLDRHNYGCGYSLSASFSTPLHFLQTIFVYIFLFTLLSSLGSGASWYLSCFLLDRISRFYFCVIKGQGPISGANKILII